MIDLLFISDTDIDSDLQIALEEMIAQKIRITKPIPLGSAVHKIKNSFFEYILINGNSKKLDSYELCREVKLNFRNSIRIFVYLPEVNINEASKFGLMNAEVEDKESIKNLSSKFFTEINKTIEIEENIIAAFSPYGGLGTSSISFLLGYTLDHLNKASILLETNYQQTIKNFLNLEPLPALLKQEQLQNNCDLDWLSGFITKSNLAPSLHYLNLFNTLEEQETYSSLTRFKLENLINELPHYQAKAAILSNALSLIAKELDGSSLTLFNEIIQAGSKLSKDFIFDIGRDINSVLNRQLLHYSQTLILILKDTPRLKEEYFAYKEIFQKRGIKNIVLVISNIQNSNNNYLDKIPNNKWLEVFGVIPIIYPYALEEINTLLQDHKKLAFNSNLLNFGKKLLNSCNIKVDSFLEDSHRGILKFLTNQR